MLREQSSAVRRVFAAWSIDVPEAFAETFVDEGSYWHANDDHRSISMTSLVVSDNRGPVGARRIVGQLPPMDGSSVDELPTDLVGWAVVADAVSPARASRALSGLLAVDGRALLVTITSDDLAWARRIWLSIRHCEAVLPP